MKVYTEFNFNREEIAVVREILNDSGVHFEHMVKRNASLENRIAERLGMDPHDVNKIATRVWRMLDRAEEDS